MWRYEVMDAAKVLVLNNENKKVNTFNKMTDTISSYCMLHSY